MEHAQAISTNASERYLLGELTASEADAFEEHYFDCVQCADDVRAGSTFLDGGRRLVRESETPLAPVVAIEEHPRRRWGWMQTAIAAMVLFPLVLVPLLVRDAAPAAVVALGGDPIVLAADTRAAGDSVVVTGEAPIVFEIPDSSHARYEVRVLGPDGKTLDTREYTRAEVERSDWLSLTVHGGPAGEYQLVISGGAPGGSLRELARRRFTVKR